MLLPRIPAIALLATGLFMTGAAQAAPVDVSLDAGTTGIGGHASFPLAPSVNVRAGMNYLNHTFDRNAGGVDYDLKLKLHTVDVLADWFVAPGSQFRISGGAVYNGNNFDALALPNTSGNYTLNGRTYSAAQVGKLSGKIDFRKTAPYLGIGWGNPVAAGSKWRFNADLGATFQGKAKVRLTNTGCTAITAACTLLANDIAREQAELSNDLDDIRVYPVLRVGISYQF
jgi:hypothetical protein